MSCRVHQQSGHGCQRDPGGRGHQLVYFGWVREPVSKSVHQVPGSHTGQSEIYCWKWNAPGG